jgi:putative intracellular protease/amidase
VTSKLNNAKKLSDVNVADYDAIFYVGGHGPVIDLPTDPVNITLANKVRVTAFAATWSIRSQSCWLVLG